MKKLTIVLSALMMLALLGCEEKKTEIAPKEELVGGFTEAEDKTVTDELKEMFDEALDGLVGATYEPVELVATQVVSGTNYKFLANGTKTTNPPTKGTYYITIYKDINGNLSVLDIVTIDESQE